MAQNIRIANAVYSSVPAIQVPKQYSGTATFTDVSDTTASAADVSSSKYFYTSAGVRTQGTNSGGSSSKNVQVYSGYASRAANSYGATDVTITVAKTGIYDVTWMAWRSSSSGTMGTNLHVNNTSGTNQQTFTNTYGQCITLNNQSYQQGDVLTLYATSGSTSRRINVGNLIIEEQ